MVCKKCVKTKKNIRTAVREEHEAAVDYTKRAKQARHEGNSAASKLFIHISKQEIHHKAELKKQLRRIG